MDILKMMIEDNWILPTGSEWIDLLNFLDTFKQESHIFENDNHLNDCFGFFRKVSQLFNFEEQFLTHFHKSKIL